ncbi:50S ribosomal protein L15 [Patescibacteria group bacterium]|nr:50S ribosomal protein L15 [Patescibacteria group bacterium]
MSYPQLKTRIKKSKRRGRGPGSGKGNTSGKGHKGQKSRSGSKFKPFFEGGSLELYRRLPKKGGFKRHWIKQPAIINISDLSKFTEQEIVNLKNLQAKNIIPRNATTFKILSKGEIKQPLTIATDLYSQTAKQKLDAAGCKYVKEKPENTDKIENKPTKKQAKKD